MVKPTKKPTGRPVTQPKAVVAVGGRPTKKTPELLKELLDVIAMGFTYEEAADYVGIHRDTIQAWRLDDEEFAAVVRRARMQMQITTLKTMETMARTGIGSWQMLAWKLERMIPEKWARKFQSVPLVDEEKKTNAPGITFKVAVAHPDGTVIELNKGTTNR